MLLVVGMFLVLGLLSALIPQNPRQLAFERAGPPPCLVVKGERRIHGRGCEVGDGQVTLQSGGKTLTVDHPDRVESGW